MGFSLKRALAGAIVGGAHAVGEIADADLKEATRQRERDEAFERQKQLMEMQDENRMRRDQQVYELKEKRETEKAKRFGTFLSQVTSDLSKEGVKVGSAEGQARIGEALLKNGYPTEGDKFSDNAIRLGQIKSTEDLRREEIRARVETARLARAARESSRNDGGKEDERGFTFAGMAGQRIVVPQRDGKPVKFDNGPGYLQQLYSEARENGMDPKDARRLVNDTQIAISSGIKLNPDDPDDVATKALSVARKIWEPKKSDAPSQPSANAPAVPATAALPGQPAKKRTPGFFESSLMGDEPSVADQPKLQSWY